MPEPPDVQFVFDPGPFIKGVASIGRQFAELTKSTAKVAGNVGTKMNRFFSGVFANFKAAKKQGDDTKKGIDIVSKGIGGFLAKFGLIANGLRSIFSIIRRGLSEIPEIGTTFGIMKGIISRNLLFPLRKELLPLLQSILTWTTRHRGLFVRWGTVLANVFRAVLTGVKTVINLLRSLFNTFRRTVGGIFNETNKNISNMVNLIIFKLTAAFITIEGIIGPIAERIGETLGKAFLTIKTAVEGVLEGFTEIFNIETSISDIIKLFGNLATALEKLRPLTGVLGKIFGANMAVVLKASLLPLQQLLASLNALFRLIAEPKDFKSIFSDLNKQITGQFVGLGKAAIKAAKSNISGIQTLRKGETVQDAIIKPDGKVIRTSPGDTLIATRGGLGGEVNINLGGINVTTTEGDALNTGLRVGDGIFRSIRLNLMNDMAASGERA